MKMPLQMTSVAVLVLAAVLCCGVVAPAEGRALLTIGKLIDHFNANCAPPPESDPLVPEPYAAPSEPESYSSPITSPAPTEYDPTPGYESPPAYASPSQMGPSPPAYETPPAGGY
uniref:Uncharacterized protein n=1 Tax=Physcomitrium patens TaxID=3218 RepID=A0A2K1KM61_PHYPA|nr:hypothetical protein PHYPA_005756 [Physcomitrium patens]